MRWLVPLMSSDVQGGTLTPSPGPNMTSDEWGQSTSWESHRSNGSLLQQRAAWHGLWGAAILYIPVSAVATSHLCLIQILDFALHF